MSIRATRLRDWGRDKMVMFGMGIEGGLYEVVELNAGMIDRDGAGYSTGVDCIEGFEEELARRYSPAHLHREIHGFCAFVESLF